MISSSCTLCICLDDRILIFGTKKVLKRLCDASVVYADGTFKSAPKLWRQIESLHFEYKGHFVTGVVALLPDQTAQTYARFWRLVRGECITCIMSVESLYESSAAAEQHGLTFSPSVVQVDFEAAMVSAVRQVFGEATRVRGCLFHMSNALYKSIASLGLAADYANNVAVSDTFNKIKVSHSSS